VLQNPRYMGRRRRQPEGEPAVTYPAAWPALVEEPTGRAAMALLNSATLKFNPRGGRRLLTGTMRCGVCELGIHVGGNKAGTPPVYRCPTGKHVTRRAEPVEKAVEDALIFGATDPDTGEHYPGYLRRPGVAAILANAEDDPSASLASEAGRIRGEMETIAREWAQRVITPHQFMVMNTELTSQLGSVEAQMSTTGERSALAALLESGDVAARWREIGVDQQRTVIAAAMDVRLFSGGRGVRVPPPETIRITWRARS